jgi:hypothetical protein
MILQSVSDAAALVHNVHNVKIASENAVMSQSGNNAVF